MTTMLLLFDSMRWGKQHEDMVGEKLFAFDGNRSKCQYLGRDFLVLFHPSVRLSQFKNFILCFSLVLVQNVFSNVILLLWKRFYTRQRANHIYSVASSSRGRLYLYLISNIFISETFSLMMSMIVYSVPTALVRQFVSQSFYKIYKKRRHKTTSLRHVR